MPQEVPEWIQGLDETELVFIKRFVLVSGSLKELAKHYGITYPTMRLRLNRLIERITALDSPQEPSAFRRYVKSLALDGRIDIETARELIQRHENEIKEEEQSS
jgi:hypothetical protein